MHPWSLEFLDPAVEARYLASCLQPCEWSIQAAVKSPRALATCLCCTYITVSAIFTTSLDTAFAIMLCIVFGLLLRLVLPHLIRDPCVLQLFIGRVCIACAFCLAVYLTCYPPVGVEIEMLVFMAMTYMQTNTLHRMISLSYDHQRVYHAMVVIFRYTQPAWTTLPGWVECLVVYACLITGDWIGHQVEVTTRTAWWTECATKEAETSAVTESITESNSAVSLALRPAGKRNAPRDATQQTPEEAEDCNLCVICLAAERSHALVPCGHQCICVACSALLFKTSSATTCPVCRASCREAIRIFS